MLDLHLAALPVLIPLIAAPITLILGRSLLAWFFATSASAWACLFSFQLLHTALAEGSLSYGLGGWLPPWGIELRVDAANAFVLLAAVSYTHLTLPTTSRV